MCENIPHVTLVLFTPGSWTHPCILTQHPPLSPPSQTSAASSTLESGYVAVSRCCCAFQSYCGFISAIQYSPSPVIAFRPLQNIPESPSQVRSVWSQTAVGREKKTIYLLSFFWLRLILPFYEVTMSVNGETGLALTPTQER